MSTPSRSRKTAGCIAFAAGILRAPEESGNKNQGALRQTGRRAPAASGGNPARAFANDARFAYC
jgi:hypothetical protein